ncbi:MAG: helix-turn-helix domain-containing protein [Bacteroidales bacterium]|nr:helix-turn-helix domain-containing protein [Bacteroidales bacterium]
MYTEKRLTVEEIAELVNRTPRTVRRWCAEIGMPFYGDARRDGNGSWRVPESTVIAYLEKEQTKQAVSDSAATPPSAVTATVPAAIDLAQLATLVTGWKQAQEDTQEEISALKYEVAMLRSALAEGNKQRSEQTDQAIREWRELREELHNRRPWWRRWRK